MNAAKRTALYAGVLALVLVALTFVAAMLAVWTGDVRWWQTAGVLAATMGAAMFVVFAAVTYPGF